MEEDTRRSISPSLPPPVETLPGPRATALQRLYADATAHILKTCSYSSFASCFPTPANTRPESLRDLHHRFTTSLGKSLHANFDDILQERDVVRSLNELDRLVNEAKKRRAQSPEGQALPVPLHTLPARELYVAHLAPSLSQMSADLSKQQEELASENAAMLEEVLAQRQQIKKLMGGLEDAVNDMEQATQCLNNDELDALRNENRSVNDAMEL